MKVPLKGRVGVTATTTNMVRHDSTRHLQFQTDKLKDHPCISITNPGRLWIRGLFMVCKGLFTADKDTCRALNQCLYVQYHAHCHHYLCGSRYTSSKNCSTLNIVAGSRCRTRCWNGPAVHPQQPCTLTRTEAGLLCLIGRVAGEPQPGKSFSGTH